MEHLIERMKEFHTREDPGLHRDLKRRVAHILLDLDTKKRQVSDLTNVEKEDLIEWFGPVWQEVLEGKR